MAQSTSGQPGELQAQRAPCRPIAKPEDHAAHQRARRRTRRGPLPCPPRPRRCPRRCPRWWPGCAGRPRGCPLPACPRGRRRCRRPSCRCRRPTRMNRAMEDAPRAKPVSSGVTTSGRGPASAVPEDGHGDEDDGAHADEAEAHDRHPHDAAADEGRRAGRPASPVCAASVVRTFAVGGHPHADEPGEGGAARAQGEGEPLEAEPSPVDRGEEPPRRG